MFIYSDSLKFLLLFFVILSDYAYSVRLNNQISIFYDFKDYTKRDHEWPFELKNHIKLEELTHASSLYLSGIRKLKSIKVKNYQNHIKKVEPIFELLKAHVPGADINSDKLLSYLAFELNKFEHIDKVGEKELDSILRSQGVSQCIKKTMTKDRIYKALNSDRYFNELTLTKDFAFVDQSSDYNYKKEILSVVNKFSRKNSKSRKIVSQYLLSHPSFAVKNIRILTEKDRSEFIKSNYLAYSLFQKKCHKSKKFIYSRVKEGKTLGTSKTISESLVSLANCYRTKSIKKRVKMWNEFIYELSPYLTSRDRFMIKLEKVKFLRRFDLDDKSILLLKEISQEAILDLELDMYVQAETIMARIYLNTGQLDKAIEVSSRLFTLRYNDNYNHSITRTLILSYIGNNQWHSVVDASNKLLFDYSDSLKYLPESRDFLFFWNAVANYELGNMNKSRSFFERVLDSYTPTYYVAMSHYLLVNSFSSNTNINRRNSSILSPNWFYNSFDSTDIESIKIAALLHGVGLRKESQCELNQLQIDSSNEDQLFRNAILNHINGNLLDSIVDYTSLSRNFRAKVPFEIERLLFPKRYSQKIESYAGKLSIDSDIILALIRQESLFNNKARSPAGARGLMQIMRRTAINTARKLPSSYIKRSEKKKIMQRVRRAKNLYNVDYNLIIGIFYIKTLLENYGQVVPALAAYNAGSSNVKKWQKIIGTENPLYFIERIPFNETRNYVKLILRNYFFYKRWYFKDDKLNLSKLLVFNKSDSSKL